MGLFKYKPAKFHRPFNLPGSAQRAFVPRNVSGGKPGPGDIVATSDRYYVIAPDGSYRRIRGDVGKRIQEQKEKALKALTNSGNTPEVEGSSGQPTHDVEDQREHVDGQA